MGHSAAFGRSLQRPLGAHGKRNACVVFSQAALSVYLVGYYFKVRARFKAKHVRYGPAAGLLLKVHTKRSRWRRTASHKRRRRRPSQWMGVIIKITTSRSQKQQLRISQTEPSVGLYVRTRRAPAAARAVTCIKLISFQSSSNFITRSQRSLFLGAAAKLFISLPQCVLCLEEVEKNRVR